MTNSERRNEPLTRYLGHSIIRHSFVIQRQFRLGPFVLRPFFIRNATLHIDRGGGFARRVKSKKIPTAALTRNATYYRAGEISAGQCRVTRSFSRRDPRMIPKIPPTELSEIAPIKN